jgi:hypothetical protein
VAYDYQASRDGAHARQFLADWHGHLMVDDYSGYKALFKANPPDHWCIELACMAHIRRKFFDLFQANKSPVAFAALEQIAGLYALEAKIKDLSIDRRKRWRQRHAKPILKKLHTWLDDQLAKTAPGGAAANALKYALKRWPAAIRYADTGHLPLDNNSTENILRPVALGRKNFLFIGTERAGKRAAAIQSLLVTAKLNGQDPAAWLKDTLEKLPTWPNSRIDELLPFANHPVATKNNI